MKSFIKKSMALMIGLILFSALLGGCGGDPNVRNTAETTKAYDVDLGGGEEEAERPGFHDYGKGKTDPVTVNGVQVNVRDYALRSYELAFMMAQKEFSSVNDLPVDLLTQYGFTHTLFENFHEINNHAVQYRTATEADIKKVLEEHFGKIDVDIKKSVLYNPEKKLFEMWIPEYGTNIYYTVDAVNVNGDTAEIITTFYNELKRESMLGRATITVKVQDGKPVISALKAE